MLVDFSHFLGEWVRTELGGKGGDSEDSHVPNSIRDRIPKETHKMNKTPLKTLLLIDKCSDQSEIVG